MKIPNKIKVSGVWYRIKFVNGENELEYKNIGRTNFMKGLITMHMGYTDDENYRTFLHEVLHVVSWDYGLKLEEDSVDRLSVGLYQVLKENKLLKE